MTPAAPSAPAFPREFGWKLLAAGFVVAAVVHVLGVALPSMRGGVAAWRHGLFVGVNALAAYGVVRRPRWFVAAFAALVAQQLASHGADLAHTWQSAHRVDVASLIVVVALPLTLGFLIADARANRRRPDGSTPTPDTL